MRAENHSIRPAHQSSVTGVVRVCWLLVRMPALAVLLALEPVVSFVLSAVGILGIAAALILRLSGALPQFPIWGMLGSFVGVLLLLSAYHALLGILAR